MQYHYLSLPHGAATTTEFSDLSNLVVGVIQGVQYSHPIHLNINQPSPHQVKSPYAHPDATFKVHLVFLI